MKLVLQDIRLPLARFTLEVDVTIEARVAAIVGPSGAGKTTLLDLIAGLRRAPAAYIELDGGVLTDTARRQEVPTRERRVGYVPQDGALFPHLSVRGNLLYGVRKNGEGEPFTLEHVLDVLEIAPLLPRGVANLSGGEKQRVALARALLSSPRLLLLDEPLSALDYQLKARILPYLGKVRDEFAVPMLYVTHHPDEVLALCDHGVVLEKGRVVAQGDPRGLIVRSQP